MIPHATPSIRARRYHQASGQDRRLAAHDPMTQTAFHQPKAVIQEMLA
jgi:hypothetical protein